MSNIITEWKKHSKEKHGSIAEGVRRLNMICNMSIQQGGIDLMEKGKRNIPVCVQRLMIGDILIEALEAAGIKAAESIPTVNFLKLTEKLSPPARI